MGLRLRIPGVRISSRGVRVGPRIANVGPGGFRGSVGGRWGSVSYGGRRRGRSRSGGSGANADFIPGPNVYFGSGVIEPILNWLERQGPIKYIFYWGVPFCVLMALVNSLMFARVLGILLVCSLVALYAIWRWFRHRNTWTAPAYCAQRSCKKHLVDGARFCEMCGKIAYSPPESPEETADTQQKIPGDVLLSMAVAAGMALIAICTVLAGTDYDYDGVERIRNPFDWSRLLIPTVVVAAVVAGAAVFVQRSQRIRGVGWHPQCGRVHRLTARFCDWTGESLTSEWMDGRCHPKEQVLKRALFLTGVNVLPRIRDLRRNAELVGPGVVFSDWKADVALLSGLRKHGAITDAELRVQMDKVHRTRAQWEANQSPTLGWTKALKKKLKGGLPTPGDDLGPPISGITNKLKRDIELERARAEAWEWAHWAESREPPPELVSDLLVSDLPRKERLHLIERLEVLLDSGHLSVEELADQKTQLLSS